MLKDLYLIRLFRQNKFLFGCVILFIFFQQYLYMKDNSSFPWFVWSMYSYREQLPQTVNQHEFYVNGKRLDITRIPIWQEATITHTFQKYRELQLSGFIDPLDALVKKRTTSLPPLVYTYASEKICNHSDDVKKYPDWLTNYISRQITCKPLYLLEIKEMHYQYAAGKFIQTDSGTTLLSIKK